MPRVHRGYVSDMGMVLVQVVPNCCSAILSHDGFIVLWCLHLCICVYPKKMDGLSVDSKK